MEKKSKSVAPLGDWVKNRIIKLITFFTCVVLIFANLFMFSFSPYGIGYKYYENNTIQIGVTQQKDLLNKTLSDYLAELGENGYYICSTIPNNNIIYRQTIIKRNEINDEKLKEIIRNSLDISVLTTKLSIENDDSVYYFKSEEECNKFINNLKEYNEDIVTTTTDEIVNVNQITAETVLQDKIEVYRLDRESRDREAAAAAARELERQKAQEQIISSRSGSSRVSYSGSTAHPLDSYTYISSYFGYRSRGFHTGVDFATPTGTEVHA